MLNCCADWLAFSMVRRERAVTRQFEARANPARAAVIAAVHHIRERMPV
jgi:hypothetical protein